MPLVCPQCGLALQGGDEAAVFLCLNCGRGYELADQGLSFQPPYVAAVTSEVAVNGRVHYLAVWRVSVSLEVGRDSVWHRLRTRARMGEPFLYVPAFSLMRMMVQQLGMRLTQMQPELDLREGLQAESRGIMWVPAGESSDTFLSGDADSWVSLFSPVLVGRADARTLAHFVYLATEAHEVSELREVDYRLETRGEELVFIPAVRDVRHVQDAGWRLLLREFDGLVA